MSKPTLPDVVPNQIGPVELCGELFETAVFSHYAYGDPLPFYARYLDGQGEPVERAKAALVWLSCQREKGHAGHHLVAGTGAVWAPKP